MNWGDADYSQFGARVNTKLGIRLNDYKPDQMIRRLRALGEKHGCKSFAELAAQMDRNSDLLSQFLDHFTINVTELYRNPELFQYFEKSVLPELTKNCIGRPFEAWSAGCSYGAEAFTLATILQENISSGNWKIRGTDIDLTIIAKANSPKFNEQDMTHVPLDRKSKYFMTLDDKIWMPNMAVKRNISFSPHDLLKDRYGIKQYDLILCRNVVIYFNDDAKDRIFQGFYDALRPGGYLFIGGTERLNDHKKIGFELSRPFFYKKPAEEPALLRRAA
ncbi:MAG: protein-glutamate O-methyltransferase CheR [Fimbriimonadaceae bacterium]